MRRKGGCVNIRKKAEILKAEVEKRKSEIDEKPSCGGSENFIPKPFAFCHLRNLRILDGDFPGGRPLTNFPFRRKMPRMTAATESFAAWACDPRRTLEERFGAELLIEHTLGLWRNKHGIKVETNYEAERLRRKERGLDPAHQPDYSREDAEHAEEVLPELKKFSDGGFDDRPLRDFSILRFCPPLECLELHHSEIRDWSPLLCQSSLTTLNVWGDRVARDLRVIGKLTRLQSLHLHVNLPWPDLRGLDNLTELRDFHFNGNVLSFRDVPQLPQSAIFEIGHLGSFDIPLRTVNDLPVMPELRRLKLDNTHRAGRHRTLHQTAEPRSLRLFHRPDAAGGLEGS